MSDLRREPVRRIAPERQHLDETAELHDQIEACLDGDPRFPVGQALLAVLELCADAAYQATRWADPLPVPTWVHDIRRVVAERVLAPEGGGQR